MGGKLTQQNGRRMAGGKPIPQSQFALPGQRYPIDTAKRARNALSRISQFGTDAEKSKVRAAVKRRYSKIKVAATANDGPAIELDWTAYNEERSGMGGGSQAAHDTASRSAHDTASRDARAKMMSVNAARSLHGQHVNAISRSGNQVSGVYDHNSKTIINNGTRIPVTHVAPGAGGNTVPLANEVFDLAGMQRTCPNCGYRSDDADFTVSGGASGTTSPSQPEELRTQQRSNFGQAGGLPLTVRGAGSPNMGLANGRGRSINLSRRLPVVQPADLVVTRSPSGSHIVRHRQGAGTIGELRHNDDGTWQSVVDGQGLSPLRSQRAALMEMVGTYNKTALTPDRAAQPLVPAPVQTPLMQQYGVPAIRLASGDQDGDDSGDGNGLSPRGQGIYKKLLSKGVKPAVAMMMAKRAQNGPPGRKAA